VVELFTGNDSKLNIKDKSYKFMFPKADKEKWDFPHSLLSPGQSGRLDWLQFDVVVVCVLQNSGIESTR
jgi:hypothetical protein